LAFSSVCLAGYNVGEFAGCHIHRWPDTEKMQSVWDWGFHCDANASSDALLMVFCMASEFNGTKFLLFGKLSLNCPRKSTPE